MRALFEQEHPLFAFLFGLAALSLPSNLLVLPMADGGMGSLALAPFSGRKRFGSAAAECYFHDSDGVLVLAALYLDDEGMPFEVDVWKVDFSPLLRWPSREDLAAGWA